jgi:hypothetical protein
MNTHLSLSYINCVYTLNIHSVKTQQTACEVVSQCNIQQYVQNNYMFRPCKRDIIRLFLEPVIRHIQWEHGGGRDFILHYTCGVKVYVYVYVQCKTRSRPPILPLYRVGHKSLTTRCKSQSMRNRWITNICDLIRPRGMSLGGVTLTAAIL